MRQHHLRFCWALREHNTTTTTKKKQQIDSRFLRLEYFSLFLFFFCFFLFCTLFPQSKQLNVCSPLLLLLLLFLFLCLRSVHSRNTEAPQRHTAAILSVRYFFFPPPFFFLIYAAFSAFFFFFETLIA